MWRRCEEMWRRCGRRCGRSINMLKALIMFVCSQKFTMQTPSPSLAGFTHLLTIGVAFLW